MISNKKGTSTIDEFENQSDDGSTTVAEDDGTETSKLSLHMLSKCAYVTKSFTVSKSDPKIYEKTTRRLV